MMPSLCQERESGDAAGGGEIAAPKAAVSKDGGDEMGQSNASDIGNIGEVSDTGGGGACDNICNSGALGDAAGEGETAAAFFAAGEDGGDETGQSNASAVANASDIIIGD